MIREKKIKGMKISSKVDIYNYLSELSLADANSLFKNMLEDHKLKIINEFHIFTDSNRKLVDFNNADYDLTCNENKIDYFEHIMSRIKGIRNVFSHSKSLLAFERKDKEINIDEQHIIRPKNDCLRTSCVNKYPNSYQNIVADIMLIYGSLRYEVIENLYSLIDTKHYKEEYRLIGFNEEWFIELTSGYEEFADKVDSTKIYYEALHDINYLYKKNE